MSIIDGDSMLKHDRFSETLRRYTAAPPRFRLTVDKGKKCVEAKCPSREPLLELTDQLEALGYQFVRLERLESPVVADLA